MIITPVNGKCIQLVLPKWENKLGGAREFMSTHCFSISEAERRSYFARSNPE
jgi:hypothetical protein